MNSDQGEAEMDFIYTKEEIKKILPHRDPFLFIDGVKELQESGQITAVYTIPEDSFWTEAHFPGFPVMPGVLLVEMMAQASGLMVCAFQKECRGGLLLNVKDARFRNNAVPGEHLEIKSRLVSRSGNIAEFECEVRNQDKILADSSIVLLFN